MRFAPLTQFIARLVIFAALAAGPRAHAQDNCQLPPEVVLAMEHDHSLVTPPELVAKFASDLTAISEEYPYLGTICATLAWVPGEVLVRLTAEAFELWDAGEFHGFDDINDQIGSVTYEERAGLIEVAFNPLYHVAAVADMYRSVDGVERAFGNILGNIGCWKRDDITFTPPAEYKFEDLYDHRTCEDGWWYVEMTPDGPLLVRGTALPVSTEATGWGLLKAWFGR